jgi:VanZ family protein
VKYTFILISVFIVYGSLYPFDFNCKISFYETIRQLNNTWITTTSRGDILANVSLFIPFGYTGILATSNSFKTVFRFILVLSIGALLGMVLQIMQICIPSRDPNLFDGVLNIIGTGIGTFIGLLHRNYISDATSRFKSIFGPQIILISSWFCYRLIPFVPSLDFQKIKNSLKPLFLDVELSWVNVFHDAIAWAAIAYLWGCIMPKFSKMKYLLMSMAITFAMETVIIDNVITASNIIGAFLGVLLWKLIKNSRLQAPTLAIFITASLVVSGLKPFELSFAPSLFHWIPFYGLLQGNMMLNTSVIFEKFFLYGTLLWLLFECSNKWNIAIICVLFITMLIEVTQMFFNGHIAEITDPLLVLVFASFLHSMSKSEKRMDKAKIKASIPTINDYEICISPGTSYLLKQFPPEGVFVKSFPFHIGRIPLQDEKASFVPNQINLIDRKPFQLSKNHLIIDWEKDNLFVLYDVSRLGTIVNGVRIGKFMKHDRAYLRPGNNTVIAGESYSDYIFNIMILDKMNHFV